MKSDQGQSDEQSQCTAALIWWQLAIAGGSATSPATIGQFGPSFSVLDCKHAGGMHKLREPLPILSPESSPKKVCNLSPKPQFS
jgi:hypothetical protein